MDQLSEVLDNLARVFDLAVQVEHEGRSQEAYLLTQECRHWEWIALYLLASGVKDPRHAYN